MPTLREDMAAFEEFLNEPPPYEDRRMVRDYRHEAYRRWVSMRDKILVQLKPE